MQQQVWFITGVSSGLGKALATYILQQGHFVIGSFRQAEQAVKFTSTHSLGVVIDITNINQIEAAVNQVQESIGKIDVLVNNAGFGFAGAIEETSLAETKAVFDANFFGTLFLTQQILPIMSRQKAGHIIQISSHGGIKAFAGFGIYNASKFAVEGFSEALAQELAPLGIAVTIVQPGPFRTGFAGAAFKHAATVITDYETTAGSFKQRMQQVNGIQEGNPEKAAIAIYNMAQQPIKPLRLPLGKIPLITIQAKLDSVAADLATAKAIAESVVYEI
jgi:NAD(P)-dependent dehydrogenase (short-subunit alcohol dehydrogenase family)